MTTKPKMKAALIAAADWLEANRDKHIMGELGYDENGNPVGTSETSPIGKGICFCATGRLAFELNKRSPSGYSTVGRALHSTGLCDNTTRGYELIYERNDRHFEGKRDDICGDHEQGNPSVISYLRKMADEL